MTLTRTAGIVGTIVAVFLIGFLVIMYLRLDSGLTKMQSGNLKVQESVLKSVDSVLNYTKGKKISSNEFSERVSHEVDAVVALEHEERRAWIDQFLNISLLSISLLALFAVFMPISMQFLIHKDVSALQKKTDEISAEVDKVKTLARVIERIDYYRLQSSIMFIVAPHSFVSATSVDTNLYFLLREAFKELKIRIRIISENKITDEDIPSLIEISLRQLTINLRSLQSLEIFDSRTEVTLFKALENSLQQNIVDISNGINWSETIAAIDAIVTMLDSKLSPK